MVWAVSKSERAADDELAGLKVALDAFESILQEPELGHPESRAELTSLQATIASCREHLRDRQRRPAPRNDEMASILDRLTELRDENLQLLGRIDRLQHEATQRALSLAEIYGSTSWRLTAPFRWVGRYARKPVVGLHKLLSVSRLALRNRSAVPLREARVARALMRSGLFDPEWYLRANPDVVAAGADPVRHFLLHGAAEGRKPNPAFDPRRHRLPTELLSCTQIQPRPTLLALAGPQGDRRSAWHRLLGPRSKLQRTGQVLPAAPDAESNALRETLRENRRRDHEFMPLAPPTQISPAVRCIAFYLPQFHPTRENDEWWGAGFTDWANVSKALPVFRGHYQPHAPSELAYYDLRLRDVQRRQAELARRHGVHGFCYYYYWFNGRRLLDAPLQSMLADPGNDLPFCLCWANENWTRRWDGLEHEVLIGQSHSAEDDIAFIAGLAPYLRDARYIRVDGRPLVIVYRPSLLPDPAATAQRWRRYCREEGIGEIYLVGTQAVEWLDPRSIGFDAAIEFSPNMLPTRGMRHEVELIEPAFTGNIFDYRALVERSYQHQPPEFPLFRSVCPGWDNTARRAGRGTVFARSSPAAYQEWLEQVCAYTERHFDVDARLVFINAWNEWAEGAYLEPSHRHGYAYLNATAKALQSTGSSRRLRAPVPRIAVIAHVFYDDLWPEIASHLRRWEVDFRLYVTTTEERLDRVARFVKDVYPEATVVSAPNRGRDIAPFLWQARAAVDAGAELICKVHTKRSPHRSDGEQWRKDLYAKLLGGQYPVRSVVQAFARNAALGLLTAEGHVVSGAFYRGANEARVMGLAARLGYHGDPAPFVFPAGSMFWARSDALRPMLDLGLAPDDFEEEARQLDGTLAHALERMFPISAKLGGYRLADTRILHPGCLAGRQLRSDAELAIFTDAEREYRYAHEP